MKFLAILGLTIFEVIILESDSSPFLTSLIEASLKRQGEYMAHSFSSPVAEKSANEIVAAMKGFRTVAFSVVNSSGHPLNSPVACCFRNDAFYVPCSTSSLKAKCISRNPAASMTYFFESSFALIVHGAAEIVESGDQNFSEVDEVLIDQYGSSVTTWNGTGIYLSLKPSRILTHGGIR